MTRLICAQALMLAAMLPACTQPAPGPANTPQATVSTTTTADPIAARAAQLEPRLAAGAISVAEKSDIANGGAFTRLANTSAKPKVVEGALEGMTLTYSTSPDDHSKNSVDEKYLQAVVENLANPDKAIRHWAIQAGAKTRVGRTDPRIEEALNNLARTDPEAVARAEAIEVLALGNGWSQDEAVVVTLSAAIKDQPLVASVALFHLAGRLDEIEDAKSLRTAVITLFTNEDPGVRGRAATVAANAVPDAERAALAKKLTSLTKDAHPYVRSQAALALGQLGYLPSAADLMPLLDDKSSNEYDLTYRDLLGQEQILSHLAGRTSFVAEAALNALQTLSTELPKSRFSHGPIDYTNVDASLALEAQRARAWYEANKKALLASKSEPKPKPTPTPKGKPKAK